LKLSGDLLLANISLNTFVRAGQITGSGHYSDSSLLRRPVIPTAHCSDSPFLWQPIIPSKMVKSSI